MSRQDEVATLLGDAVGRAAPLPVPDRVRVASVSLAVRDLDGVERFYRKVVGLHRISAGPGSVFLGVEDDVLLVLEHRPDARPDDPASAGLYHTAFLLPSRAELGAWLWHASRRGVRLDGAADHLVSEALYLHDPENNGVEIYADRPRAGWAWQDGRVDMTNRNPDFDGILASATAEWAGAPRGTRVGHVHLRVGDVAAARAFWTEALGLDVTRERGGAVFLSSDGYHHHVACNTWSSAGAGAREAGRTGLLSVRLEVRDGGRRVLHDPWGTRVEAVGA